MHCPSCGASVEPSLSRCPACGVQVSAAARRSGGGIDVLTPIPERSHAAEEELTRVSFTPTSETATNVPLPVDATIFPVADGEPLTTFHVDQPTTYQPRSEAPDNATIAPGTAPAESTGGPLAPGQSFGRRYHIIRMLGVGGMGAVYQAWDAELGVAVAIKVIRPDVMADPTAAAEIEKRFKRELLLARQVTHKNVVRIHDLGEIDGIKYITMPYVDGADLSTVLKRDGRLLVPRMLRIARSVVSGLVEAHKAGVVHRDLKPPNIMINAEDEAMIMDFGIARSTGNPSAAVVPGPNTIVRNLKSAATANMDATVFGAVVGTVEYMAPEQAKGLHVDQRADVYAFGLIMYDMLAGQSRSANHPGGAIAELQGRMQHAPAPVKTIVPEVPEHVDAIIQRCLEPDPDKRFQTSEELATALAALDDEGVPIPIPARFSKKLIAAAASLVIALVTATWYFTRTPPPPKQHDPVTVLIADFANNTADPTFDHTLEPMLRLALEGAGFISAHDRSRIRASFGVAPPAKLDEAAARDLALKQGVGFVLSGSVDRRGNGYEIAAKATESVSGKVIATVTGRASSKDEVLAAATKLTTRVRKALGDETRDSAQLFGMTSISATSLEVVHEYAAGHEAQANGKFEDARQHFAKSVALDPNFALGYQGLAGMSRNLGYLQDMEKYLKEALRHLDKVTDRERLAIRGLYYANTGDYQQCVKEYGELAAQYTADAVAHNQRAWCLSNLRNMREAVNEQQKAVNILPKRLVFRGNLAVYSVYAGDFETAEREAQSIDNPSDLMTLALAFSQVGRGQFSEAGSTYQKLATLTARGASWSASGLGDLAAYEGRFSEAIRIFDQGATADLTAKNPDKAARKLTSLAYVHLLRHQNAAASAAAEKALLNSKAAATQVLAARVLIEVGGTAKAREVAKALAAQVTAEPHAYGKIIEGNIALKDRDPALAMKTLTEANDILDTWLGHFDLGRAYLALRMYTQADSEFDRCIKRRGEALAFFIDEEPTYAYFPLVYYYQGGAREGLNTGFADSYREYLNIRGKSTEDPLVPELRKRTDK